MIEKTRKPAILLSIQPVHASRIFEREKLFELRKVLPKRAFGSVYLYQSGSGGIVGCFEAGRIITKSIPELWNEVGERATPKARFFRYFSGWDSGHAIGICKPIRFPAPISLQNLQSKFGFRPPQGFVFIEADSKLFKFLDRTKREALSVVLKPLRKEQSSRFIDIITHCINGNYDEIDAGFAESILRSHFVGKDPKGIFTKQKIAFEIFKQKEIIGFTTMTLKRGGSAKTGPTVLFPEFQGIGVGQLVRDALLRKAEQLRVRKLYCTCAEVSKGTFYYLLKAGYRVEAHLQNHYTPKHSEFVLGRLLQHCNEPRQLPRRHSKPGTVVEVNSAALDPVRTVSELSALFSQYWTRVDSDFADGLISESKSNRLGYENKPFDLLLLVTKNECIGAGLLVPKRGGAVKLTVVAATSHTPSLCKLLHRAESLAVGLQRRKIYLLHPLNDHKVLSILRSDGYLPEGVLREPYSPGVDCVVMAKFLDFQLGD